jgi:hypothetical protein
MKVMSINFETQLFFHSLMAKNTTKTVYSTYFLKQNS